MKRATGFYPRVQVDTTPSAPLAQAGGVTLTETVAVTGLGAALATGLGPWRKPLAVHDPAKVVLDLALTLALGGECLADVAILRAEPGLYGLVASDATISRTIDALAEDAPAVLKVIDRAGATARARAWALAAEHAPDHDADAKTPVVIDLDATLVASHSEKEHAARTRKKGCGFHPLCAFLDHGAAGTGEPLAIMLRAGNAGSNTATDHISVLKQALAQLPGHAPGIRAGRRVLVRTPTPPPSSPRSPPMCGPRPTTPKARSVCCTWLRTRPSSRPASPTTGPVEPAPTPNDIGATVLPR